MSYQGQFPDGYCKDIIGHLPVYGSFQNLNKSENKLHQYEIARSYLLKTRHKKEIDNIYSFVRQSCLDMVDDVYCHYYFQRCNMSSRPQLICRETCQKLYFEVCDREFAMVKHFVETDPSVFIDIINCKTLSFRSGSSNCYYPDKIRGQ